MRYFPILPFIYSILFYSTVVVTNPLSGVTSCQKWDVEKRVEAYEAVVHQLQEDFNGLVASSTLASATGNSTHGIVLFLSLHLLHPLRNSTSPLPLPSCPSPSSLLLPYPTNHSHRWDKGKVGAIETFEFLERQTAIGHDMDGCIPKEFDPTFQFKVIAFTCSDQVHFLPIVAAPLLFRFNTW